MKPLETIAQEVADIARQNRSIYGTVIGALNEARKPLVDELAARDKDLQVLQSAFDKAIAEAAVREKIIEQLQFDVKMLKAELKTQEREFTSMTSRATALKFWQELKNDISARDKTIEELRAAIKPLLLNLSYPSRAYNEAMENARKLLEP